MHFSRGSCVHEIKWRELLASHTITFSSFRESGPRLALLRFDLVSLICAVPVARGIKSFAVWWVSMRL